MLKQISEKQLIVLYEITYFLFMQILGNLHCFINHHQCIMVPLSGGCKPMISSKKGQFPSKHFKKTIDGSVTPRRLSKKQSENKQQCQWFRFRLFQKLDHVILQS